MDDQRRLPDFLIIGAQKAGTTWLWSMLDLHPGTALPKRKEPHFFGSSELYAKGLGFYGENFQGIGRNAVTGEASTSYLSKRPAFFYNDVNKLEYDDSLPLLPELVARSMPDVKIVVSLRDPVRRAVSSYFHFMRQGKLPVSRGLIRTVEEHPRLRILEYSDYAVHLPPWLDTFAGNQVLTLVFEEDIVRDPANGLRKLFEFLDLDPEFRPPQRRSKVNKSWNWTQTVVNYYAGPLRRFTTRWPLSKLLAKYDWLKTGSIGKRDIAFLRDRFLPTRDLVSSLIDRDLSAWDYGGKYDA